MLCIAAFIVFCVLGIFSAYYRKLAAKAWYCVVKRITFKPCDITLAQEIKGKLLGKIILKRPKVAKFFEKWIDVFAFAFIVLSIWSVFSVAFASLNLLVYDTCDPTSQESCSLGGEACTVGGGHDGFFESMGKGDVLGYFGRHVSLFVQTVSRFPDRFVTWKPEDFVTEKNTYYQTFDPSKKIFLEILDPSCQFCAKQFKNIKKVSAEAKYNMTYFVYPIPNPKEKSGYKFPHSMRIATYLEAIKIKEHGKASISVVPKDWQLLEKIFTGMDGDLTLQEAFNLQYDDAHAVEKIHSLLEEIGYSKKDVEELAQIAQGTDVQNRLLEQKNIVEQRVRTVKIPTVMFGGRRYDRVVQPDQL